MDTNTTLCNVSFKFWKNRKVFWYFLYCAFIFFRDELAWRNEAARFQGSVSTMGASKPLHSSPRYAFCSRAGPLSGKWKIVTRCLAQMDICHKYRPKRYFLLCFFTLSDFHWLRSSLYFNIGALILALDTSIVRSTLTAPFWRSRFNALLFWYAPI